MYQLEFIRSFRLLEGCPNSPLESNRSKRLFLCLENTMENDRYNFLMHSDDSLTEKEVSDGWHFCADWDGLLINNDWPESECCSCAEPD